MGDTQDVGMVFSPPTGAFGGGNSWRRCGSHKRRRSVEHDRGGEQGVYEPMVVQAQGLLLARIEAGEPQIAVIWDRREEVFKLSKSRTRFDPSSGLSLPTQEQEAVVCFQKEIGYVRAVRILGIADVNAHFVRGA